MFVIRQIHKYLGISVAVLLLISAVTGFLRANYVWYWKPDYKQHKHPITEYSRYIQAPGIGISELETIIVKKGGVAKIKRIELLNLCGKLLYKAYVDNNVLMLDAMTGELLTPISKDFAIEIATQYVSGSFPVKNITDLRDYVPFKGHNPHQVYRVNFDDNGNTEIFIDKYSGDVVEELDNQRRFAHFVVNLHDFNFLNLKRTLLCILGFSLVSLSVSGIFLFCRNSR